MFLKALNTQICVYFYKWAVAKWEWKQRQPGPAVCKMHHLWLESRALKLSVNLHVQSDVGSWNSLGLGQQFDGGVKAARLMCDLTGSIFVK